jgi:hypothetical protein
VYQTILRKEQLLPASAPIRAITQGRLDGMPVLAVLTTRGVDFYETWRGGPLRLVRQTRGQYAAVLAAPSGFLLASGTEVRAAGGDSTTPWRAPSPIHGAVSTGFGHALLTDAGLVLFDRDWRELSRQSVGGARHIAFEGGYIAVATSAEVNFFHACRRCGLKSAGTYELRDVTALRPGKKSGLPASFAASSGRRWHLLTPRPTVREVAILEARPWFAHTSTVAGKIAVVESDERSVAIYSVVKGDVLAHGEEIESRPGSPGGCGCD